MRVDHVMHSSAVAFVGKGSLTEAVTLVIQNGCKQRSTHTVSKTLYGKNGQSRYLWISYYYVTLVIILCYLGHITIRDVF